MAASVPAVAAAPVEELDTRSDLVVPAPVSGDAPAEVSGAPTQRKPSLYSAMKSISKNFAIKSFVWNKRLRTINQAIVILSYI